MIQQPICTSSYFSELSGWNVRCNAESCPSGTFILCCYHCWGRHSWCWRGILGWRHSPKMADHEMCVPASIGFGETTLIPACIECRAHQMCVRQRKHIATTCGISFARTWFPSEESTTEPGPGVDHRTGDCPLEPDGSGENAVSCQTVETLLTGLRKNPEGRQRMFTGIATSEISWGVTSADGSWRVPRKPTLKLIGCMTEWRHMRSECCKRHGRVTVRWHFLTFCQRRFGGHLGSSRIRIYGTWPALLRACLLWVLWWSHNKLWIQDIFTLLHSIHDLYAATATTFLMKITWLLAGIFMYGTE